MIIDSHLLNIAKEVLQQGFPIVFPTETVYGLGANAYDDQAVQKIFDIKNRPSFNPLIVHYHHLSAVLKDGIIPVEYLPFLEKYWPGPLTIVIQKKTESSISSLVTAGLQTIAVRIPSHPLALSLLESLDFPLAAPSANTSGFLSPTSAKHVQQDLGEKVKFILDGGECTVGLESTIIDLTQIPVKILRPGSILSTPLVNLTSLSLKKPKDSPVGILCPGQLEHHYAPHKSIRLNALAAKEGEGYIIFGSPPLNHSAKTILQLSTTGNLEEAASNLYKHLHTLDHSSVKSIAVMPIPEEGIGIAINDRLKRAAAPKEIK